MTEPDAPPQVKQARIEPATMSEALRRIRQHTRRATEAARAGDNMRCYSELELTQHAAFDAKALFNGAELPEEENG